MIYVCDCCAKQSEEPHGCDCGGSVFPNEPLALDPDVDMWDQMPELMQPEGFSAD